MRIRIANHGDKRIITRFLFFPMQEFGEFRWLEVARYEEHYLYNTWIFNKWVD